MRIVAHQTLWTGPHAELLYHLLARKSAYFRIYRNPAARLLKTDNGVGRSAGTRMQIHNTNTAAQQRRQRTAARYYVIF